MERSILDGWGGTLFQVLVFAIWIQSLLRLYHRTDGEVFLHQGAIMDSILAVSAPLAIYARILQTKIALKASRG